VGTTERFDFSSFSTGAPGNSEFGQAHGPGIDLRPTLPTSTTDLVGVDLTHTLHAEDVAPANAHVAGGGGGGGGGSGGGLTFANYTTSGPAATSFNITIQFKGTFTQAAHDIFVNAADRLASLITNDLQNVTVYGLKGGPVTVDDILITAELKAIDGAGGILGQAGPTSVRTAGHLPATASMQFDSADAASYIAAGLFDEIVTHEMLHSVGFGSVWSYFPGLVSGSSFTGANAVNQYHLLGGVGDVPIETEGGSGTAGSHWSEAVFDNELMTGYINGPVAGADPNTPPDPLSAMTVASLADLGYVVNLNGPIDGYALG
jgi:hypothetical protein